MLRSFYFKTHWVATLKHACWYRSNTVEQYLCLLAHVNQTAFHINISDDNWQHTQVFLCQHIKQHQQVTCPCTVSQCQTRHTASTSMYTLTFCVRVVARMPPVEARSPGHRSNVENVLPPSTASHWPAARADPAERSHYVVISRDGRKLVTRVRVMLP